VRDFGTQGSETKVVEREPQEMMLPFRRRDDGPSRAKRESIGQVGDDGARTRHLCRDSVTWSGFATTYKPAGTA